MRLVIPIYSMRSHKTGKYHLLKDGNFKLHINRLKDDDVLALPSNMGDLKEILELGLLDLGRIKFFNYGENAYDTRKNFWKRNLSFVESLKMKVLTDITGYPGDLELENNFNITRIPELSRPYVDEFWESDLDSIEKSTRTTVLNEIQKKYIVEERPHLEEKVIVDQRVISKEYFDKIGLEEFKDLPTENFVFFPFRISDKAYKFDRLLEMTNKNTTILITDPNDSYQDMRRNVKIIKPNKRQYYWILSQRPNVVYYENPNLVFHPGLADFLYFKCNLWCPYEHPTLEDVIIEKR